MSDRIFGVIGLLLAMGFAYAALQIQESFLSDAVGPKAFPLILATLLGLSSLAIILKPDPDPLWPALPRLLEILFSVLVMVLYAIYLPELGFVVATAIAASYLTWRLGTAPLWSLVVGVSTSVGIYVVFHLILGLSLARGPWGF
ncbi:tripartite tricarboxylate transporter TctB family protein [Thalassococcus sp. BH17M4-6]|uniref:tripartite tricarboxylate transporter TctB family protein n=1 Tax=Thalassococcus sp. BH17M4-6 TaxID=3413148 RepID=UPI003BEC22AC